MMRGPRLFGWLLCTMALAPNPIAGQDDLTRGQVLFQEHCAGCHGPAGEGGRGPTLAVPKLANAETDEELIRIIQSGVPGSAMPEALLDESDIKRVALWVRALGRSPAVAPHGNVERGAAIYAGKGGCRRCHAIQGDGGSFGPDLTEIGTKRGPSHLRTSLTDPNADVPRSSRSGARIPENFLLVDVEAGGRHIIGVRVNEDPFSIQVREQSGRVQSLRKSDVTVIRKEWGMSPMPSYRSTLSDEELDDLVAFLATRRGTP